MPNYDVNAHRDAFPLNQGILSDHLYEILKLLMRFQHSSLICGDIMEIGVLSGATSAYLALSLTENERLFLVDAYQDIESASLSISSYARISSERVVCLREDSKVIYQRRSLFLDSFLPSFKIVHIDGEHSYDAVISDLHLASSYLSEGGIIILDDIFNVSTACCTHALFDAVRSIASLHIACIGFNKAFVCGSKYLGRYRTFFLSLPPIVARDADLFLRVCFNDWSFERGYLSMHHVLEGEPSYQMINKYSNDLDSLLTEMHLSP